MAAMNPTPDITDLTADLPVPRRRAGEIKRNPSPNLRNPSPGPDGEAVVKDEPADKGYEVRIQHCIHL